MNLVNRSLEKSRTRLSEILHVESACLTITLQPDEITKKNHIFNNILLANRTADIQAKAKHQPQRSLIALTSFFLTATDKVEHIHRNLNL